MASSESESHPSIHSPPKWSLHSSFLRRRPPQHLSIRCHILHQMSITLLILLTYPTTPTKFLHTSRRRPAAAPSLLLPHHPPLPQSQSRQCLLSILSLLRPASGLRSRSGPRSSFLIQVLLGRIPGWHLTGVPPQQDTCPLPCSSTTVPQQRCWSSPSPTTHTSSILRRRTSSPPPSLCPHPPHLPLSPSQHRAPGNQSSILRSGPGPDLGQQPNQIWSKS